MYKENISERFFFFFNIEERLTNSYIYLKKKKINSQVIYIRGYLIYNLVLTNLQRKWF
jgi:hypothetical protein